MVQARQQDAAERVVDLALAEPYGRALLTVRGYAAGLLDAGYPRGGLRRDLVRARDLPETRGAREEAQDVPADVADLLDSFSASFMRL